MQVGIYICNLLPFLLAGWFIPCSHLTSQSRHSWEVQPVNVADVD